MSRPGPGRQVPKNQPLERLRTDTGAMADVRTAARKVLSLPELRSHRAGARQAGQTVVQCHGCFDIVHPGHIRHLQHAAKLGDVLLVTITGDAAMAKGTGRPLIPQELRAENLAALDCVDWVCIDPRPTAADLLEDIQPDVYVKGREYEANADPRFKAEREAVERHGGRVVFSSGDIVFSSTALIAALQDAVDPFTTRVRQLVEQHEITPQSIETALHSFRGARVCVVGQTVVDTYILCDRPVIAGEGPIMTLRPIERRSFDGGAAVIARHLAALGAAPVLVTALPRTPDAEAMRQRLLIDGVETQFIDLSRPLAEKQRFLVGAQKVMKLDLLEPVTLDAGQQKRLIDLAERAAAECHAAIVVDFGQGLLTPAVTGALCEALRPHVDVLSGDVSGRRSNLLHMRKMDLLCPTEAELRDALNDYDDGLSAVVWKLLEATSSRGAMITLAEDGLVAFDRVAANAAAREAWHSRIAGEHVPSFTHHAIDPLGCGDALLATATLTLARTGSFIMAAVMGSLAAGAHAERLGNNAVTPADLRRGVGRLMDSRLMYTADSPQIPRATMTPPAALAQLVS